MTKRIITKEMAENALDFLSAGGAISDDTADWTPEKMRESAALLAEYINAKITELNRKTR